MSRIKHNFRHGKDFLTLKGHKYPSTLPNRNKLKLFLTLTAAHYIYFVPIRPMPEVTSEGLLNSMKFSQMLICRHTCALTFHGCVANGDRCCHFPFQSRKKLPRFSLLWARIFRQPKIFPDIDMCIAVISAISSTEITTNTSQCCRLWFKHINVYINIQRKPRKLFSY